MAAVHIYTIEFTVSRCGNLVVCENGPASSCKGIVGVSEAKQRVRCRNADIYV